MNEQLVSLLYLVFGEMNQRLTRIESTLRDINVNQLPTLIQQGENIMATQEQINAALSRLNVATNSIGAGLTAVGAKIEELRTQISNAGLSAEAEAAALATLDSIGANLEASAASLNAMAQDPANPVPVEPPAPIV